MDAFLLNLLAAWLFTNFGLRLADFRHDDSEWLWVTLANAAGGALAMWASHYIGS